MSSVNEPHTIQNIQFTLLLQGLTAQSYTPLSSILSSSTLGSL